MESQSYGLSYNKKAKKRRRKITGIIVILIIILTGMYIVGVLTSNSPEYKMRASAIEENHILKEQISELEEEVKDLKAELKAIQNQPTPTPEPEMPETPRD